MTFGENSEIFGIMIMHIAGFIFVFTITLIPLFAFLKLLSPKKRFS